MPRVVVSAEASRELTALVSSRHLPAGTRRRVAECLRPLAAHPRIGVALGGAFVGYRFILGPWRWMLLVYRVDDDGDTVVVMTIQDARAGDAATEIR